MGFDYKASIVSLGSDYTICEILEKKASQGEPETKVTLYQALPKASKMDLIIQKTVELGVHSIIPIITDRVVVRLAKDKDVLKKQARWQRISEAAAKQSGRGITPTIHRPMTYSQAIMDPGKSLKLVLWEGERDRGLRSILDKHQDGNNIAVLIGPEGGLTQGEVSLAGGKGWIPVSLGPRILRTETSSLSVLSAIMYRMEEMEWK